MAKDQSPEKESRLSVEPNRVYLGRLKPGEGASAAIKVTGGPVKVMVGNDRIKVNPSKIEDERGELEVAVPGGSEEDLIWDEIVLRGESGELNVLVTAWWENITPETSNGYPTQETGRTKPIEKKRTYRGRTCVWCGNNIRYDMNTTSWLECEDCRSYRKVFSLCLRLSKEMYLGIKEIHSALVENWQYLTRLLRK